MAKKSPVRSPARAEVADLRAAVERLSECVQVLTAAVDELTDELQWRNNHLRHEAALGSPPPVVLTSMPADPTAKDWKLNQYDHGDQPSETPAARPTPKTVLFD